MAILRTLLREGELNIADGGTAKTMSIPTTTLR